MRTILFVGRLAEVKGCAYLIRAFAEFVRTDKNCELVIIGDGPLRKELEQLATDLNVKATFTGTQPAGAVREWIAKSRVVCVPSITTEKGEREGFGRKSPQLIPSSHVFDSQCSVTWQVRTS